MNRILIIIILLGRLSYAQHTAEFEKIASKIEPSRTEPINIKFKNGNQKEKGINIIYEFENYEYIFYSGKRIEFYKNGQIMSESEYDSYGHILTRKLYDSKGNLFQESESIKIDTKAKTVEEFLHLRKYFEILTYEKKYKYSFDSCMWYLLSEGEMLNNKKIGKWKKYSYNGEIKKETEY